MGRQTAEPPAGTQTDRDQDHASELRRVREQLFALAEVARAYRDAVMMFVPAAVHDSKAAQMMDADTNLRDVLLIVARMKRFT